MNLSSSKCWIVKKKSLVLALSPAPRHRQKGLHFRLYTLENPHISNKIKEHIEYIY